jgi:hypothetical protein
MKHNCSKKTIRVMLIYHLCTDDNGTGETKKYINNLSYWTTRKQDLIRQIMYRQTCFACRETSIVRKEDHKERRE